MQKIGMTESETVIVEMGEDEWARIEEGGLGFALSDGWDKELWKDAFIIKNRIPGLDEMTMRVLVAIKQAIDAKDSHANARAELVPKIREDACVKPRCGDWLLASDDVGLFRLVLILMGAIGIEAQRVEPE